MGIEQMINVLLCMALIAALIALGLTMTAIFLTVRKRR